MSPSAWLRAAGVCGLLVVLGFIGPAMTEEARGKKYALLVGVTEYKGEQFAALKFTENDVEKLAEILIAAGFDKVRVLTNARGAKDGKDMPTAANVKKAIDELVEDRGKRDTVLVAFSGHGANVKVKDPDEKGKDKVYPFFCPYDASLLGISYSTGGSKFLVNLNLDLFDKLELCGARSKLVLIDACRNEFKAEAATRDLAVEKVTIPGGVGVLFSCSKDERAWESAKLKHGVFFHFVLEGLRGKARNEEGEVTWKRLMAYVTEQVERQVGDIVGGGASQTPHELGNVRGTPVLVPAGKVAAAPKDRDRAGKEEVVKGKDEITNSVGMRLKRVRAGKFKMGSPKEEKERDKDDEQQHEVEITKDFYLGVTEVTQKQFKEVMGYNPSYFSKDGTKADGGKYFSDPAGGKDKVKDLDTDDFPVENVSWEDAREFMKKLNARAVEKKNKLTYRLPSEAEWEYSCRGGASSSSKPFHFKTPFDALSSKQANFNGKFPYGGADEGPHLARTCAVGSYDPNALGLYDMHGNVWEWCSDWYGSGYYDKSPTKDPPGPDSGSVRVFRGGSWSVYGRNCRAAYRFRFTPSYRLFDLGFRVAAVPHE